MHASQARCGDESVKSISHPLRLRLLSRSSNTAYGFPALGSEVRHVTAVVTHLIGAKRNEPLHGLGGVLRMDGTARERAAPSVLL